MADSLPPVDESVAIPPAVKAAAARAEAFYNQPEQTPEPPAAEATPPAQTPEPQSPAPTPAPPETQGDPRVAELEAKLAKQARDYNALLGRNAQQRDMIALQQTQLSQMANPRSWAQPQPQTPQPQPRRLVTDEERKAYGDEALSVMERKTLEVVTPIVENLNQQNQRLQQELQRVKAHDVYDSLDTQMPDWRTVNGSDEWKAWLRLPDLYSGMIRQQLLDQAFAAGDASRVLAFFRGYLAEAPEHSSQEGSAPQPEPPAEQPPVRKAAIKLETLAAPGRAQPSPPPSATAAAPTITNKEVSRFYWDVTHGRYAGRDAAKAAREAEIHAAVREGRVRIVK